MIQKYNWTFLHSYTIIRIKITCDLWSSEKPPFFYNQKHFSSASGQRAMIKKSHLQTLIQTLTLEKSLFLKNRLFSISALFFLTDFFVQINSNDTDTAGYPKDQYHSNKISGNQRSPCKGRCQNGRQAGDGGKKKESQRINFK